MADTLTFAVPVEWSKATAYEQNIIVFVGKRAYTSLKAVPTGIEITDTSYWAETGVPKGSDTTQLKADIETLKGNVSTLKSDLTTTNSNVTANNNAITSIRQDITNAQSLMEYDRQEAAGVYDGRDLVSILGASSADDCFAKLHSRAQAKNAAGIRVGDYIDVTPTVSAVNNGAAMRYRVAGIAHNLGFGDQPCPWAFWMIPDNPIDVTGSTYTINTRYIYWNTTANNNGVSGNECPYLASNLHQWELEEFLPALPTALQNVLVSHRILLEKRYSSSGALTDSTGWGWVDAGKVFSLSETEVYGNCVWGTKGYSVGEAAQLPLFRVSRYRVKIRVLWWLRTVRSGSSSNVCTVTVGGNPSDVYAKETGVRPRPCFLIG